VLVAANVFTTHMRTLAERWKLERWAMGEAGESAAQSVIDRRDQASGEIPVKGRQLITALTRPAVDDALHSLTWAKQDFRIPDDGELGPSCLSDVSFAGLMVVLDWDQQRIVWRSDWRGAVVTPAGHCYADDVMYLNDLEAAHIFVVDMCDQPGRLLRRISHPYLNDLHSIRRTRHGLLVTCSGVDLVMELGLDGHARYEWWAAEHGYVTTPSGHHRLAGRNQEHRSQYYHTRYQTTHVNDATFTDASERYLLALLFHQGQLVRIDRAQPADRQEAEVLIDGVPHPHSLQRTPTGWLLCSSSARQVLLLDERFQIRERIAYSGGWLQDCRWLSGQRLLLNDVDNHRLVELSGPRWTPSAVLPYDPGWRMGELAVLPPPTARRLRSEIG
jgi:hypothetical protein